MMAEHNGNTMKNFESSDEELGDVQKAEGEGMAAESASEAVREQQISVTPMPTEKGGPTDASDESVEAQSPSGTNEPHGGPSKATQDIESTKDTVESTDTVHSEALEAIRLTKEAILRDRSKPQTNEKAGEKIEDTEQPKLPSSDGQTQSPKSGSSGHGGDKVVPNGNSGDGGIGDPTGGDGGDGDGGGGSEGGGAVDLAALDALLNLLDDQGLGGYAEALAGLGVGCLQQAALISDATLCSPEVGMDSTDLDRFRRAVGAADLAQDSPATEVVLKETTEGSAVAEDSTTVYADDDAPVNENIGNEEGEKAEEGSASAAVAGGDSPAPSSPSYDSSSSSSRAVDRTPTADEQAAFEDFVFAQAAAVAAEHRMQRQDDAAAKATSAKGAALAAGAIGGVVLGAGAPAVMLSAAAYSVAGMGGERGHSVAGMGGERGHGDAATGGGGGGGGGTAGHAARAVGARTMEAVGTATGAAAAALPVAVSAATSVAVAVAAAAATKAEASGWLPPPSLSSAEAASVVVGAADNLDQIDESSRGGENQQQQQQQQQQHQQQQLSVAGLSTAERLRLAQSALSDQLRLNSELVARAERLHGTGADGGEHRGGAGTGGATTAGRSQPATSSSSSSSSSSSPDASTQQGASSSSSFTGRYAFTGNGGEESDAGVTGGGSGSSEKDPQAKAVESLLRDRLGHFKLDKDSYNTHFYELHHDHSLAQQNLLQGSGATGNEPKGDILFWTGSSVRAARLAGMLATGGLSALWSSDGYGGNRLAELRVRADDVTTSEMAALFRKCITHDQASFTLNRVKEYARETGLRVVEYSYCSPRHARCGKGDFAVFLELEAVPTLTSHHGVHPGGGGGGSGGRKVMGATAGLDGEGGNARDGDGDVRSRSDTWEDYLEVGV